MMGKVKKLKRKYFSVFSILLILVIFVYINVAMTSATTNDKTDIAYNDLSPSQKLDIFYPKEEAESYPVVLYLHGGSYLHGDKDQYNVNDKKTFTANGYVYVAANYRLSNEKVFPAAVDDVKTIIRYLKEEANSLKINIDRIYVLGHSAGANLGSMVVSTKGTEALGNEPIKYDKYNSNIAGFIGIAGFYDVNEYLNDSKSKEKTRERISKYYKGFNPNALANNTNYIKNLDTPVLLQHGKEDRVVNYKETIKYCNRIQYRSKNKNVTCEIFPTKKHSYEVIMSSSNIKRIIEWMNNN